MKWYSGILGVLLVVLLGSCVRRADRSLVSGTSSPVVASIHSSPSVVDNRSCYGCHPAYDGETLSLDHERAGIGCRDCHGVCVAHNIGKSVEDAPDVMFSPEEINPACFECHSKMDLMETPAHDSFFAGTSEQDTCTDCHGEHRLAKRVIRWDRHTGNLLWHK